MSSALERIEIVVALNLRAWKAVEKDLNENEKSLAHPWLFDFNGSCRAMKAAFPVEHPGNEEINVQWADAILAKADPLLVETIEKEHIL